MAEVSEVKLTLSEAISPEMHADIKFTSLINADKKFTNVTFFQCSFVKIAKFTNLIVALSKILQTYVTLYNVNYNTSAKGGCRSIFLN